MLKREPEHAEHGTRGSSFSSASAPPSIPLPSQASQRPCFVLNENQRGSSSGNPVPQRVHVRAVESVRSAGPSFGLGGPGTTRNEPPPHDRALSTVGRSSSESFPK